MKCAIFGDFTKLYLVNGDYLDMRSLASLKNESCWISWYLISVEPKRISTNWWGFNTDAILSVALNILVPLRTSASRQPNDHLRFIKCIQYIIWIRSLHIRGFVRQQGFLLFSQRSTNWSRSWLFTLFAFVPSLCSSSPPLLSILVFINIHRRGITW